MSDTTQHNPNLLAYPEVTPTVDYEISSETFDAFNSHYSQLLKTRGQIDWDEQGTVFKRFDQENEHGRLAVVASDGNVRAIIEARDGGRDEEGYPTTRTVTFGFNRHDPNVLNYGADGWRYVKQGTSFSGNLPPGVTVAPSREVIDTDFAWFADVASRVEQGNTLRPRGKGRKAAALIISKFIGE